MDVPLTAWLAVLAVIAVPAVLVWWLSFGLSAEPVTASLPSQLAQ